MDWWDVPGRDEAWKIQTIKNTSERQFAQEFSNDFHGTGNTLINANALLGLKATPPLFTRENINIYKDVEAGHHYIMCVDVAKGRGMDFSTFSIIDISTRPFQQVATFRDDLISPLLLPTVLEKYAKLYNNALVIVENNDQGTIVCNGLYYDIEYENLFTTSSVKANSLGVFVDKKVKRIGASNFKDLVEEHKLNIVDKETIRELCTYAAKGSSYEATEGNHDDTVSPFILFGWYVGTPMFKELTDVDVQRMIYDQRMKEVEDDVLPFGIVDDGSEDDLELRPFFL